MGGTGVLTLNGNHAQTVKGNGMLSISNLVINSIGTEEICIDTDISVSGSVKLKNGKVAGSASLLAASPEILEDSAWSGNLTITEECSLKSDLSVDGKFNITAPLHTNSHSIYAGSLAINASLYVENGAVYAQDTVYTGKYGKLIMQDMAGYLLAGGSFLFDSKYAHDGLLTAGTIEVKGDFIQQESANFKAESGHQVILAGKKSKSGRKYIQTVSFSHPGEAHFNVLVLKKDMSGYQFRNDVESICNELVYDIEDTVPPTDITEINTISSSVSSIEISYSGVEDESDIMGYEIYRNGKKVGVTGNTSFKDAGLEPDTAYTYCVYAFDEYGNISENSPEMTVRTAKDTIPPSKPENLRVKTRTGSGVTITWDVSEDNALVAGYRVYRDGVMISQSGSTAGNLLKDTGLEKNTVYTYCVEAVDSAGNVSEKSDDISVTVSLPHIISVTPEDNTEIGGTQVNLSIRFKNSGNSTGNTVKIEYREDGGEWKMVSPTLLGQKVYDRNTLYADYTWNIERLKGDKEYTVRYTLTDSDGNTAVEEAVCRIDRQAPNKVLNVKAEDNEGVIKISYDASKSADCEGYRIYRKADNEDDFVLIKELYGRYTEEYRDKDVVSGQSYEYTVTAYDKYLNESEASDKALAVAGADISAPVIKSITPGAGRMNGIVHITATAEDNIGVKEIRLEYRKQDITGHGTWTVIGSRIADTSGSAGFEWDSTCLEDGAYIIRAVASDDAGNFNMDEYTRRYVLDNTGIGKMNIMGVTCLATAASVRWEDVPEDDFGYFRLEMAEKLADGTYGDFRTVATVSNTLGYSVTGLKPDTDYAFRVVGYDNLGNRGTESDIYTGSTAGDDMAPQITSVYPVESHYNDVLDLKMTVKDNAGVEKGIFYYSADNVNFTEIVTVNVDGSTGNTGGKGNGTVTMTGTDTREVTFTYAFDISGFPEGSLYIRFEAYDSAGNKNAPDSDGNEITAEYQIDRTAPAKLQGVRAVSGGGYIELTWDESPEEDVKYYKIYKADEKDGIFRERESECRTKNYYDTSVGYGESYLYKVAAVDVAGNISELSDTAVASPVNDTEPPVIRSMSPYDGSLTGTSETIKVLAVDNAMVNTVTIEYRKSDDDESLFTTLVEEELNEKDGLVQAGWNTAGLDDGEYIFRAYAKDTSGNTSKPFEVRYTLDTQAPAAPYVQSETGDFCIRLSMSGAGKESDFAYYEIRRREAGTEKEESAGGHESSAGGYRVIARISGSGMTETAGYTDKDVETGVLYDYVVRAYDFAGNHSESFKTTCYADDNDTEAPAAVLPENLIGMEGMEIAFDGTASTDNVRITDYTWYMGDGTVKSGAQPVHTYEKAGDYTVILRVKDARGNSGSASMTVRVLKKDGNGISCLTVMDETGAPLPFADIYVQIAEDRNMALKADGEGKVTIGTQAGAYKVAAYKAGYLPADTYIYISMYETGRYELRLKKGDVVTGDLSVRKLSYEELVEAGVDLSDPENYNTFGFDLTLTFAQMPVPVQHSHSL